MMREVLRNKIPLLVIVLITLLFAKLQTNKRSDEGRDVCANISSDARGYYAWLPAIFIYHDLNFNFYDSVEVKDATCGVDNGPVQDYRNSFYGRTCDKYYPGTSIMALPFFAIAHLKTTYFSSYAPNGYTFYYFRIMALSAMFYYFLGMFFFAKILDKLKLSLFQKTLTITLLTFGSNIIYYVIDAPLYSHIYSFFLTTIFVYFAFSLRDNYSSKNIAGIAFITGMIFITRPVNISILLVLPFILGANAKVILTSLLKNPSKLVYTLPVVIMPLLLSVLYKLSTGHYFIYSYSKEGFDFLHPQLLKFMFHYDNGVFLYLPLLLMPLLCLFVWYKKEYKTLLSGIFATLFVTFYIHSSWWCWNYGFSFGARTILDFMPLFGIVIGLSLKQTSMKQYIFMLPVYFLCCGFTMLLYHEKSARHFMGVYPITDFWDAILNAFR